VRIDDARITVLPARSTRAAAGRRRHLAAAAHLVKRPFSMRKAESSIGALPCVAPAVRRGSWRLPGSAPIEDSAFL